MTAYRHALLVLSRARRHRKGIRAAEKALQRVVHEEMRAIATRIYRDDYMREREALRVARESTNHRRAA